MADWTHQPDPWLTQAIRHEQQVAAYERQVIDAVDRAMREFLTEARRQVLRTPHTRLADASPDPKHDLPPHLDTWPDWGLWPRLLRKYVLPVVQRIWTTAYHRARPGLEEALRRSQFVQEIQQHLEAWDWPAQVYEAAQQDLSDGQEAGDSISQLRERLNVVLRMSAPIKAVRDKIARLRHAGEPVPRDLGLDDNEYPHRNQVREASRWLVISTANRATLDAAHEHATQTGEAFWKTWYATSDQRVRDLHWHRHKEAVPLDEAFMGPSGPVRYPGDPLAPPGETANCRCTLLINTQAEADQMNDERARELPNRTTPTGEPIAAAATAQEPEGGKWRGLLAPLDTRADFRVIGHPEDGEVRCGDHMWLSYQESSAPEHGGKVAVGRIDKAWIEDGQLMGEGTFNLDNDRAAQVARDISNGFAGTVSVDLADAEAEERFYDAEGVQLDHPEDELAFAEQHPDARKLMYVYSWRLDGATLVQDPAFHNAAIHLVTDNQGEPDSINQPGSEATTAAGNSGVSSEKRQRAEKAGAAMKGGRYPIENADDLRNAIKAIGRAGGPDGTSAERAAVKAHIIRRAKALGLTNLLPDDWTSGGGKDTNRTAAGQTWAQQVADAVRNLGEPPAEWFADPQLTGPKKVTVADTGRVYGHVATWDTDHISYPGRNVRPPRSETNYAQFHRHPVRCAGGQQVRTGVLVMGTGHADLQMSESSAASHYDHTGYAVADVVAGEDAHGIWISGALHPQVSALQIQTLDRYSLSGDWRNGELVAALVVNVPGFPIADGEDSVALAASGQPIETPRLRVRTANDGSQFALVASGIVRADVPQAGADLSRLDVRTLARELRHEMRSQEHTDRRVDMLARRMVAPRVQSARERMAGIVASGVLATWDEDQELGEVDDEDWRLIQSIVDHDGSTFAKNWVDKQGGLPSYIKRIAKHLKAKGMSESHAIATAVNVAKKMCSGGDKLNFPGAQADVNKGSVAQACAAVASWNKKKAAANAD